MTPQSIQAELRRTSGAFRALCLLLVATFMLGGGARGDIQSLFILRPIAIGLLFYGLSRIERRHIAANRAVLALAIAMLMLLGAHLVPLPPSVWSALPGRDLVVEIDRAAGLGQLWRPLSLAPDATFNALYAALVPCAALVLGVQLDARERRFLLWPVLILGGLSALLGVAQIAGPSDSALYFYQVTNDGAAVGLFANRNHQAMLLATLLPVLAVWAASDRSGGTRAGRDASRFRSFLALLAGAALVLLILVTGSRAGLVLAVISLAALPVVHPGLLATFREPAGPQAHGGGHRWLALATGLALIAMLAGLAIWRGRGLAVERLLDSAQGGDLRFLILPSLLALIRFYLPLGSGLGSFERVFQMHEPDALLRPDYANHAHNDWLEVALTGGIPALLILVAACWAFFSGARRLFGTGLRNTAELRLARLGMTTVLLAAIGSLGDYPLRVPSLACFFVVSVIWMSCPLAKKPPSDVPS